jgi:hypothetical protein
MGYQKGTELEFCYEYDFSVSGGAASGNIALVNKGNNALESGLVITDFSVNVEAELTSGGSAAVTMGNAGDVDGYLVDFFAAGATGAVLNRGDRAGALVWDDTNDHPIHYKIDSAANAIPTITVTTAALTAGKFKVYFKAYKPR